MERTVVVRCTIARWLHTEPIDTQIAGQALPNILARALPRVDTDPLFAELAQRTINIVRTARWSGNAATIKATLSLGAVNVLGAFFGCLEPSQG